MTVVFCHILLHSTFQLPLFSKSTKNRMFARSTIYSVELSATEGNNIPGNKNAAPSRSYHMYVVKLIGQILTLKCSELELTKSIVLQWSLPFPVGNTDNCD